MLSDINLKPSTKRHLAVFGAVTGFFLMFMSGFKWFTIDPLHILAYIGLFLTLVTVTPFEKKA